MILAQVAACLMEAQMLDKAKKSALDVSGLRTRYDNFIGGAWKAPAKGRYFTNKSPIDGSTLCEVARSDAADVERGARRRACGERQVGPHLADRARENAQHDRRSDRGQSRAARPRRDPRQRQADPRDDERRRAAVGRSFPLFRRLHPRGRRNDRRDRPRHGRLSLPRADGRGRPDHSRGTSRS